MVLRGIVVYATSSYFRQLIRILMQCVKCCICTNYLVLVIREEVKAMFLLSNVVAVCIQLFCLLCSFLFCCAYTKL